MAFPSLLFFVLFLVFWIESAKPEPKIPAGKANNPIPKNAIMVPNIFPKIVIG